MTNHKKAGIPLGAFAIGALAGAIAGILLAPKAGKETREDVKRVMHKIKDDTVARLAQLKEISKETYDSVVASVVETYKNRKEITQEEAHDITERLKSGYEDLKKIAVDTKDAIQKDIKKAEHDLKG